MRLRSCGPLFVRSSGIIQLRSDVQRDWQRASSDKPKRAAANVPIALKELVIDSDDLTTLAVAAYLASMLIAQYVK
jgi:hypothetical protein